MKLLIVNCFLTVLLVMISCKGQSSDQENKIKPLTEILNIQDVEKDGFKYKKIVLKVNSESLKINGFSLNCLEKNVEIIDFIKDEVNGFTPFMKYILIVEDFSLENCKNPKIELK